MKLRISCYLAVIVLLVVITYLVQTTYNTTVNGLPLKPALAAKCKIVLLPLDSRPPCTQFVKQLGSIAGIEVVLPPTAFLDNYKTPANREALRQWLLNATADAEAAIIAVDMLVHGGLLASRIANGDAADVAATLSLLEELNKRYPQLKIYAFNIIPRLLLADNSSYANFRHQVLEYSVLQDLVYTFENPRDIDRLEQLQREIPPSLIDTYRSLYENTANISLALISLVEKGVITSLVLGQDDSQPFGIPNITVRKLENYIAHRPHLADKVHITQGTDEVALTLLGQAVVANSNHHPQIAVRYSHPAAPAIVMPYMPHSVAKTVQEKVDLIKGTIVDTPDKADFILYVHIGTKTTTPELLERAALEINDLIKQGYRVAVVDLSENFAAEETLLPVLIDQKVNILQLAGYAGWNTTSNSVGTAVTQGVLFTNQLKTAASIMAAISVYQKNLEFLIARFLDDWYYQKDVKLHTDRVLTWKKADRYMLGENYSFANRLIQRLMVHRANQLHRQVLSHLPIFVTTNDTTVKLALTGLELECYLPWHRTFEVYVQPHPALSLITEQH